MESNLTILVDRYIPLVVAIGLNTIDTYGSDTVREITPVGKAPLASVASTLMLVLPAVLEAAGTVVSPSGAVKTSDDPLFDKEALRVVKLMPRFVPDGEGQVVSGSVEIPVMFRLK